MANQIIVSEDRNQITVVEGETRIVEVVTQGPQGPVGPSGPAGPSGSSILNQITSGSVTASVDIGPTIFSIVSGSSTYLSLSSSGSLSINGDTTIQGNQFNAGTYWRSISGSSFPIAPWRGIAYGNGLFVAIADRSASGTSNTTSIATSPDGVTWTFRTIPSLTALTNIIYQNGIFVAVGRVGQRTFYSYDGINWFNGTGVNGIVFNVTYGKDKFVVCKIDNANNRIDISYDGKTWQGVSTPSTMDLSWTGLTYGNDRYVAVAESSVSGSIAISTDGLTWNNVTRPSAGVLTTYNVTYGKGLFVVTCNQGKVMTSPDGVTWTVRDTPLTGLIWKCIFADGVFIAAGAFSTTQNKFIYSVDGITWQEASTPALNDWGGFAYGNGLLLAVSYNGPNTGSLIVSSGVMNSFTTQNDNRIHGRQIFTDDVILSNSPISQSSGFKLDVSGSSRFIGNTTVNGNTTITGSLTVTGAITAQTLVVQTITSSVSFITGSTKFGSLSTNTHEFTGSIFVSGSTTITSGLSAGSLSAGATTISGLLQTPAGIFCDNNLARFRHITVGVNQASGTGFIQPEDTSQSIGIRTGASFGGTQRLLVTNTGLVAIGSHTPIATLDVSGSTRLIGNTIITGSGNTSATNALTVLNSAGSNLLLVRNDGLTTISGNATFLGTIAGSNAGRFVIAAQNFAVNITSTNPTNGEGSLITTGAITTTDNQTKNVIEVNNAVTSTAATFNTLNGFAFTSTINQTLGTIRGLYINPTLTSATNFRAIEWSNNASGSAIWGLYGAGSAPSYLSGSLNIGTTTLGSNILNVSGSTLLRGSGNILRVQNNAGSDALIIDNSLVVQVQQDLQLNNTVIYWNSGNQIRNTANGILRFSDSTAANFTRLQFGGTTSAFPGIQRVGGSLAIVGADGSTTSSLLIGQTTDDGVNRLQVSGSITAISITTTSNITVDGNYIGKGPGTQNVYIGSSVGGVSATGAANMDQNVFIGHQAGTGFRNNANGNVAIGALSLLGGDASEYSTAVGWSALQNSTGQYSTAFGAQAGLNVTTGNLNTIIGYNTGRGITTGGSNTIIGAQVIGLSPSLSNTVIIADGAGSIRFYSPSSGDVGIGTTNPIAKLDVRGTTFLSGSVTGSDMLIRGSGNTSTTTALTVQNSAGTNIFAIRNDGLVSLPGGIEALGVGSYIFSQGGFIFGATTAGARIGASANNAINVRFSQGSTNYLGAYGSGIGNSAYLFSYPSSNNTDAATNSLWGIVHTFNPTSGTSGYIMAGLQPTINQTGGANGITRGLYINPTLTAAADFRAIEWSNNAATAPSASWGLYGAGTAPNYLAGGLSIGTTLASQGLRIGTSPTRADATSLSVNIAIPNIITSSYRAFASSIGIFSSGFTLPNLSHFEAINDGAFTSGVVTNLYGFKESLGTYNATNVYGFYGDVIASSSRWNLYMNGTAANYLNGSTGIGTTSMTYKFNVTDNSATYIAGFRGSASSYIVVGDTSLGGESGVNLRNSSGQGFIGLNGTNLQLAATSGANTVSLWSGGTEGMRLTNTRNVLIGLTTDDTINRLQVSGSSRFQGNMVITGSSTLNGDAIIRGSGNTSATTALTVQNSSSQTLFSLRNDRAGVFIGRDASLDANIRIHEFGGSGPCIKLNGNSEPTFKVYDGNGFACILSAPEWTGIGRFSTTIISSAALQIDSTIKGFLPPRMTTTQMNAISGAVAGLIVYDSTVNKHYGYDGTTWNAFY